MTTFHCVTDEQSSCRTHTPQAGQCKIAEELSVCTAHLGSSTAPVPVCETATQLLWPAEEVVTMKALLEEIEKVELLVVLVFAMSLS